MTFPDLTLPFSDPVLIFALAMLLILLSPLLSRYLKLPSTVGLILAGMVVGPSMGGLLARDATIVLLGTVGLQYLIFSAALSMDLDQFVRMRGRSIGFGLLSVGLPFALAYWLAPGLLGYGMAATLLLGAIVGSHTLLAYPSAARLGIGKIPAVTVTMGATLVTDVVSLMVLAVVAASYGGGDIDSSFWWSFGIGVSVFVLLAWFAIPALGRWFFRTVRRETEAEYVFLLAVLFVTAVLAEWVGLAPIIGAFMAGLLLNRLVPDTSPLMNRVQFMGNALFVPFFLLSVGMLVDVRVMSDLAVWKLAGIFTGMVVVGKTASSWMAGAAYRFSIREIWVMSGLTIPQAAATLAVTLIGFDMGLFDALAVNAVVIMILITCLMGPWLVERYGRIIAQADDDRALTVSEEPRRILVPLSNPTTAEALMDVAFAMRDRSSREAVYPLTVVRDGPDVHQAVATSEKMLSHAVIYAASADVPVHPVTRVDMNIPNGIVRAIKERRITDVVIGWNGQVGTTEAIFGSVLDQLLPLVDRTLMVCNLREPVGTTRRVFYAIPPFATLERGFGDTLRQVKILTNAFGAELHVIGIDERMNRIKSVFKANKPDINAKYHPMAGWSDLIPMLKAQIRENDLLILQSAREGMLSWRAGLNRLPGQISTLFPDTGFITVYPSILGYENTDETEESARKPGELRPEDTAVLFPSATGYAGTLALLAHEAFPKDHTRADRLTKSILDTHADFHPELIPGLALFENAVTELDEPQLIMAICREAFQMPHVGAPVHVVALLLHPLRESSQAHLDRLNRVARTLRNPDLLPVLLKARNAEQVQALLREAAQSG